MQLNEIAALDAQYFLGVFGKRFPVCFVKGKGTKLYDTEGKEYTDFLAGIAVNALGYGDPGLTEVLHKQVDDLLHVSNYFYIEPQAKAAKALCEATGYDRVFFSNSGSEAMEGALKLARKYFYDRGEDRPIVVSMQNSFHGRTLGALAATGQPKYQEPFAKVAVGCRYVPYGDLEALEAALDDQVCAVLLEPIQGEGGVIPAGEKVLKAVRKLCDDKGILMITDEIQTGMGRTGSFLCTQKYGVQSDIVTMAKALGGGVAVGAFLATQKAADAFQPGDHGSTFGGNQLATAAAYYMIQRLNDPAMLAQVRLKGGILLDALKELNAAYPTLTDAPRGEGLMLGLPLAASVSCKEVAGKLLEKGFVVGTAGGNCIRLVPSFIIEDEEICALKDAIASILEEIK